MEHREETTPEALCLRMNGEQPLWLLWNEDGTYLVAGMEDTGPVLLSWTTQEELDAGVQRLGALSPELFRRHRPIQRRSQDVFETAHRLDCRLWIDGYLVEGFRLPLPSEEE
jgi:hypothetical protein